MSAVSLVRWWRPAPVGPSWPQPPAASQTLWRFVLLATLLHLWLIVVVGNTQGVAEIWRPEGSVQRY